MMLDSLFIGQVVQAIGEALGSADLASGRVAVLGQARAARALTELGYSALVIGDQARPLRRLKEPRVAASLDRLPVADGGLDALVAFDASRRPDWDAVLAEWTRATRTGGAIVLVDRSSPSDLTRRVLCAGLLEIEQRQTGRTFVTSGRVGAIA